MSKTVTDDALRDALLATQSASKAGKDRLGGVTSRTVYRWVEERDIDISTLRRPVAWLPADAARKVDSMGQEDLIRLADLITEKF